MLRVRNSSGVCTPHGRLPSISSFANSLHSFRFPHFPRLNSNLHRFEGYFLSSRLYTSQFKHQRNNARFQPFKMTSPFTGGLPIWDSHQQSGDAAANEQNFRFSLSKAFASVGISPPKSDTEQSSNSNSSSSSSSKSSSSSSSKSSSSSSMNFPDLLSRFPPPVPSTLSLEERIELCMSVAEECIQPDELGPLLAGKKSPVAYDGFEPSGRMHIAQGLLKVKNVNRLTQAGCTFVFWVADYFAFLNNKMGGDLKKIRKVGEYFLEVWKSAGMDMTNVRFLWASEEIERHSEVYWQLVMDIARANSISRIKRCSQIMGRAEGDEQPAAQILYPCMQCADIFFLKADICQLGLDQRKVNVLAREFAQARKGLRKPLVLAHKMMPGLEEGQEKMAKSNPDSAIFMEDSEAEVNRKIKKAFCPPSRCTDNPCVVYVELLVFPSPFEVSRTEENGGNITFKTAEEFKEYYSKGLLHPADLKAALAKHINKMLEPVRKHFQTDEKAKQLLKQIAAYNVTR